MAENAKTASCVQKPLKDAIKPLKPLLIESRVGEQLGGGRQEAKLLKDAAETAKSASYVQKPLKDAIETTKTV